MYVLSRANIMDYELFTVEDNSIALGLMYLLKFITTRLYAADYKDVGNITDCFRCQ